MRKQSLRPPPRPPREAKRGQVPCRARRHGDLRSGFAVAWSERPFLSSQRELLVSIGSTSPASIPFAFRSPSGHRTTPLLTGALACHLAINCGLGLLLRNAGRDLGLLPIDAAKADIAIGPYWPSRQRLATYLRHCKVKRACRQ